MRSACPPIMYSCKYLNFSRATNEMELLARQIIMELEGEEGFKYIEEYSDSSTKRGKNLRDAICKKLNFASLEFQSLEGVIKAIGLEPCKLCTYCWNGKEQRPKPNYPHNNPAARGSIFIQHRSPQGYPAKNFASTFYQKGIKNYEKLKIRKLCSSRC